MGIEATSNTNLITTLNREEIKNNENTLKFPSKASDTENISETPKENKVEVNQNSTKGSSFVPSEVAFVPVQKAEKATPSVADRASFLTNNANAVRTGVTHALAEVTNAMKNVELKEASLMSRLQTLKTETANSTDPRDPRVALANTFETLLNDIKTTSNPAARSLKVLYLERVQKIMNSNLSPQEMSAKLKQEKNLYTEFIKDIQETVSASSPQMKKNVMELVSRYAKSGNASAHTDRDLERLSESVSRAVYASIASSVAGTLENSMMSLSGGGSSQTNQTSVTSNTSEGSTDSSSSETTPSVVSTGGSGGGQSFAIAVALSTAHTAALEVLTDVMEREPSACREALQDFKEHIAPDLKDYTELNIECDNKKETFKEQVGMDYHDFMAMKLNEIFNDHKRKDEILIKFKDITDNKTTKSIEKQITKIVANIKKLEANLPKKIDSSSANISSLLNRFRSIISELDLKTRDVHNKVEVKNNIDVKFQNELKKTKDKFKELEAVKEKLLQEFEKSSEVKESKLSGIAKDIKFDKSFQELGLLFQDLLTLT